MPSLITNAKFLLALLSVAGFYATWYLLLNNGTTNYMSDIRDFGPRLLPGTKEPLRTVYVGIPAIDYQLTVLTLFFWEQVDGSDADKSLFCFHFATQVACGWGLLLIEGYRNCNRWKLISFIGIWGILVQNAAYAVVLPMYLILYLSTSPMVSPKDLGFLVSPSALRAIPVSMAVGYVLPTVLMSLPAPSLIDYQEKQMYMAIWQMFPLWVSLIQEGFAYAIKTFTPKPISGHHSESMRPDSMAPLRNLYMGLLMIAGIGQVATCTLIAASALFPVLLSVEFRDIFNASNVFRPAAISSSMKMPSIGSGAHMLLQYDEAIGSSAMMIWSTVLFVNVFKMGKSTQTLSDLIIKGTIVFVVTGPLGYATACVWARDEMVQTERSQSSPGENRPDAKTS